MKNIIIIILAISFFLCGQAAPSEEKSTRDQHAWIGILVADRADNGVYITATVPGGPAESAGVRPGDLLLAIGDEKIVRTAQLSSLMRRFTAGEMVPVVLQRDGSTIRLAISSRVKTKPGTPAVPTPPLSSFYVDESESEDLEVRGAVVVRIPAELRAHYGAPADAGLLVTRVIPGTAAAMAGLLVGDILIGSKAERFATPFDMYTALLQSPPGGETLLQVIRDGQRRELILSEPEEDLTLSFSPLLGRHLDREELRKLSEEIGGEQVKMLEEEIRRLRGRIKELEHALEKAKKDK